MNIQLLGEPKIVMHNPHSKHNYFAWPTVVRLQDGRLAAAASGFRLRHICPFGKTVIAFSSDEGETWSLPAPVIDTPLDDRDAGLCPFDDTGLIVTSFNNTAAAQQNWLKSGHSFALDDPKIPYAAAYIQQITPEDEEQYLGATYRVSRDCGTTFGPIHRCPVSSPHGPIQLRDGTILWVGREFSADDSVQDNECVRACRITPEGEYERLGSIPAIYDGEKKMLSCEPHTLQLPDGKLLCHIRVQEGKEPTFTTYQSESTDGGCTWSQPHALLSRTGGAPAHLLRHSSGVLISVYGHRSEPLGIRVMFSRDDGGTWDTAHQLYTNPYSGDLGYPATVELNDGSLLTVFYAIPEKGGNAVIMQQKWRMEE